MIIGYARVSTDGQTLDSQIEHLSSSGCQKVFAETASGAKTDRRELRRFMASLAAGDVLVVVRLDRLARSTRDLLNVLAELGERGGGLPLPVRRLGRYQNTSWPPHAHCARGSG